MANLSTDRLQPPSRVPQPQVHPPQRETSRNPRRRPALPQSVKQEEAENPDTLPHQIDDLA